MAASVAGLAHLSNDCAAVTGRRPKFFLCPILLEDADVELAEGHILPQALRETLNLTTIQRKDVDNYFGQTIEPDCISFLNSPLYTKEEFLDRARDVTITGSAGIPLRTFVPSPESSPPFPKVGIKEPSGKVIFTPHVRGSLSDLGGTSGTGVVEGSLSFSSPAIVGSLLKAAHLALFRLVGYRWVFSAPGRNIAKSLSAFFTDKAEKKDADKYFGDYSQAAHVILHRGFSYDTLRDSVVLLHDLGVKNDSPDPFAISCVFTVNRRPMKITLPFSTDDTLFDTAIDRYKELVANWKNARRFFVAEIGKNKLDIIAQLGVQHTNNPSPELLEWGDPAN